MTSIDGKLLGELRGILGIDGIVSHATELKVYECDGWTVEKSIPDVLLLPRSTTQVSEVLAALHRRGIAFVPRGAGTGLSGGCLPLNAPAMICTSKMNRILEIDCENRRVEVESGVVNLHVTNAVKANGFFYAPDPSSQVACTIGGNIAENSGGPHTLKYGVTTNHVLALEVVLPDGEVVELGGPAEERCGYDLVGAVVGAEGTTGIVTRATLKLMREPENHRTLLASFPDVDSATRAVSTIIASGIVPAAVEMMATSSGATSVKLARDEAERALLWKARKRALGAVGRLAPNYATQDGVVPRTCLPRILSVIGDVSRRYELRIGNVFHAGDGNLHPVILYDEREPGQVRRAIDAGREILKACIEMGGSLTGEHGIGVEKLSEMPLMFSPGDIHVMTELRHVFDPMDRSNPGKVIPSPGACVEVAMPRRQVPI